MYSSFLTLDLKTLFLKTKVMLIFVKIMKFQKVFKMAAITLVPSPKSFRWSTCKKNEVKALEKSNSGQKGNQNQCYKKCQEKTLESGFGKWIFFFLNEPYKDPNSLLSLSLCIQEHAREIERVKERKKWKRSNSGQLTGARPVEGGARPVGRGATRPAVSGSVKIQWARPVG